MGELMTFANGLITALFPWLLFLHSQLFCFDMDIAVLIRGGEHKHIHNVNLLTWVCGRNSDRDIMQVFPVSRAFFLSVWSDLFPCNND